MTFRPMKWIRFLVLLLLCSMQSCNTQSTKINGVSFVASREPITKVHTQPLVNINASFAALMPFGFMGSSNEPKIKFNGERQWFGETDKGIKQYAEILKAEKIKIMLKPQIWIRGGTFTGFIEMTSEADWKLFEESYSKFILSNAQLAEAINAELFCIGTELERFVKHRPKFWSQLISDVKQIYKGKLTYASNWNEFKQTPFWEQLDYIGIDAYFPVSDSKAPSVKACKMAWEKHKEEILNIANTNNKPILFTEYGYRSVDYAGKAPWNSDRGITEVNLEAQANATQALFDMFWHEDWFAGGFVWKWHHNHQRAGGENNNRFTPQNKPAEIIIKKQYGQN